MDRLSLDFLHALQKDQISGVVSVCVNPQVHLAEMLGKKGVPLAGEMEGDCSVLVDPRILITAGLEALAEKGKKHISYFSGKTSSDEALRFFKKELKRLGLKTNQEWIHDDLVAANDGAGWECFKRMWRGFGPKPDGLLVMDDVLFNDIFMALIELGVQIPEQLAVATHSNRGSGLQYPVPVTYLEVDPDEYVTLLGRQLVGLLRGELHGKQEALLPVRVVETRDQERFAKSKPSLKND